MGRALSTRAFVLVAILFAAAVVATASALYLRASGDEEVVIQQCWGEIRRFMWNFVGIVRTTKRLERAKRRIDMLRQEVSEYYRHFRVTPDLIELRNLLEVADLIVRSALSRHESRGLHYTLDHPELADEAVDTVLIP